MATAPIAAPISPDDSGGSAIDNALASCSLNPGSQSADSRTLAAASQPSEAVTTGACAGVNACLPCALASPRP